METHWFSIEDILRCVLIYWIYKNHDQKQRDKNYGVKDIRSFSAYFKAFGPNVPFLNLLKTWEKPKVFWRFQGIDNECTGNKWVKITTFWKKN